MHRLILSLPLLALAACGSNSAPGPGGVTANETAALEDAAEMIENQRLPETAVKSPEEVANSSQAAPPAK